MTTGFPYLSYPPSDYRNVYMTEPISPTVTVDPMQNQQYLYDVNTGEAILNTINKLLLLLED